MNQPPRWQFVLHLAPAGETWTWRRLATDGEIEEVSEPHVNFAKAVNDALAHGFLPNQEYWVINSRSSITHFVPGEAPVSLPADAPAAWRGAAPGPNKPERRRIPRSAGAKVLREQEKKALAREGRRQRPRRGHRRQH